MFNLKKIYGVISFELEVIRILIVEKENNKTNLIYFDQVDGKYYDVENQSFINEKETLIKVLNMVKGADNFIGNPIKRYIVNNCLFDIRVVENESPTFLVFDQTLTSKNLKNYISKINFLDSKTDEMIVKIQPTVWKLDNKEYEEFPLGEIGSSVRFKYLAYVGKRLIVYQFANLIESLKISILTYTSNEISFSGLVRKNTEKNENCLVVNISSEKTWINFFDSGKLVKTTTHNFGSKKIEEEIKIKFGINKESNIKPILKSLRILDKGSNDVVMINIHKPSFLSVIEGNNSHIQTFIEIMLKKIVKIAIQEAEARSKETGISYDKIFMHIDDLVLCDISKKINLKGDNKKDICFFQDETIGLGDENIINLIGSIETTIYEQEANREVIYSTDAFLSQDVFTQQTKKQIVLKLGMLSTKWSAKLGE